MNNSTIRRLRNPAEVLDSYRLRHEVYGRLGYLNPTVAQADIELDQYDSRAIHFGAFGADGSLVGTLRLVLTAPPHEPYPDPGALPSITSDPVAHSLHKLNVTQLPVRELSRAVIHPAHRGSGIFRGLVEFGIAHAAPALLVGGCLPEHLAMYAKYGYRQLPDTGLEWFEGVRQTGIVIVCDTNHLPEPMRPNVTQATNDSREQPWKSTT